jgi:hypothetical protein
MEPKVSLAWWQKLAKIPCSEPEALQPVKMVILGDCLTLEDLMTAFQSQKSAYDFSPPEHWGRRFESHSRHGYMSAFFCAVVSCGGRGLVIDRYPIQGIHQISKRINSLRS